MLPPPEQKSERAKTSTPTPEDYPAKRGSRAPRPVDLRCGLSEVGLAHNVVVVEHGPRAPAEQLHHLALGDAGAATGAIQRLARHPESVGARQHPICPRAPRAPDERRKAMKIGIYTRVSRDDGTQNPENQVQELRGWAERLGGTVVAEYGPEV